MITKFLYCKYDNLKKFIHDGAAIRFTDTHYYANLENERIRDNESKRDFNFTSNFMSTNKIVLQVDDFNINSEDIVNLQFSFKTRRAHVLCLSNDGNSQELFNHFNADTCIEIDVDFLIRIIKDAFKNVNANVNIIGKDVYYYYKNNSKKNADPTELVFMKQYEKFHVENEYRVAIFYPYGNETIINKKNHGNMKLFGNVNYIEIGIDDEIGMRRVIVEARRKDGSIIS